MGSNLEEPSSSDDEITVLVTGFGPFRSQNPVNPSWEITKSLPQLLPPEKSLNAFTDAPPLPPVRILIHPEPVKVAYKEVRELVPKLWDGGRKIDFMIHIGMASGRRFYSVERRGHRDGYYMKDVDDKFLDDLYYLKRTRDPKDWIWNDVPEELTTAADIDDVWRRWRLSLPQLDVRISEDAGRYLCDFIYFSSLAHLLKKDEERRVVFLHVPVESDENAVQTGTEVTLELIRALVQSMQAKKVASQ
jgi:pyrrolidone-carboxylate peptidase